MRPGRLLATAVHGWLIVSLAALAQAGTSGPPGQPSYYRPKLKGSEALEPFLKHVEPGSDSFPVEGVVARLELRLAELSARIRTGSGRAAGAVTEGLLAPGFRGGRLQPGAGAASVSRYGPLQITRAEDLPQDLVLDARAFAAELARLLRGLAAVATTELLVTSIEADSDAGSAETTVRYDVVGRGAGRERVQLTGSWRMRWTREGSEWRIARWTAASLTESRATGPTFTEVTEAALGATPSFRHQLGVPLDAWSATFDSVLTRDSNGHHGVSVGDADGDGHEDLYVAQPSGLPNRLYRALGDGRFEDVTEAAGVGVLDDTAQSLFADVDNDGDQDLVLSTGTQLLLFANDGRGRFAPVFDAFRYEQPVQGSLTSIAMADYDRDGFLDLYLCVYSYFYGAGEDKAGTPMPYHDARNGPPAVLFRNDGRGRFVDVTRAAGLAPTNDRYHFAAAWADYDGDGWIDLLVANDFGAKNLYRSRGRGPDGRVTFEDVAAQAGVLDHAAGMSAAFLDYDNDGRLDIYAGNMWSAAGLRVTAAPAFMKDAEAATRALYRRHARGNSLFRNLGDGRFEDVTIAARAEMGRWAWASDALDFDCDGFEDLYVVNGMLTREQGPLDLDGFFWRQVVARSPLAVVKGTPYDDAWRAINQELVKSSIASRQRNVMLRGDGRGGFDDVSGALGLDLDQDGRSFAVLDADRDGDPDLVLMAARQAPQLRLFRNDFSGRGAALALRLSGQQSNRDAIGAHVTLETDGLRRTRLVTAGSGFISQHSKELLFGLGASRRVTRLTVAWPSGRSQVFADLPVDVRLTLVEGGELESAPFAPAPSGSAPTAPPAAAAPPDSTWLHEPFPAPEFSLPDLDGDTRSLAALRGEPALLLFWSSDVERAHDALRALSVGSAALDAAGIGVLAIALDDDGRLPQLREVAQGTSVPVIHTSRELGLSYAILNRHLFMNRQDLRLPTAFLLDAQGRVVKAYRDRLEVEQVLRDATQIEADEAARVSRAVPFAGTFYSPPAQRNYLTYGHELLNQGLEREAVVAFERAAQANPSASTLYRLGTLLTRSGEPARARAAYERALGMQPDMAEASNDLGALLAREGDLPGAIERFREALAATPDYPDALNNLGYALLLTGNGAAARPLYEKALELSPDFPEAMNNLGLLLGRAGDLAAAEPYFRDALARRPDYGDAANNLALVLVSSGRSEEAVALLRDFLARNPEHEASYLTLAKIYLSTDRTSEGIAMLERLLQLDPRHPVALELVRQMKPRS